jgi:hypothetical protein
MKNTLLLSFILLSFAACQPLRFDRYEGTSLKEIPEKYIGKYEFFNKTLSPDTAIIWIGKKSYTQINASKTEINFLDSTHVFSTYKNYDFLSHKEDGRWVSFYVKKKGDNIVVTPIVVSRKVKNKKAFLEKYFSKVDTTGSTGKDIEKSSFSVKMNEEELLRYLKKIKKESLTLKKVIN